MGTRKTMLAAGALALALLGTAGCSGGAAEPGGEDPATQTGTLRVVVPNFPADNEGQRVFQLIVDEFHQTYPQMEVQPDFVPYDGLNQKISTSLAAGNNYDVISAGIGWVQPLADLGAIQSLDELGVDRASVEQDVLPTFIPPMMYEDQLYALPVVANPQPMAYSKSAFEEAGLDPAQPPRSLAEVRQFAETLTTTDGAGEIERTGFDFWAETSNYRQQFVGFMSANGGTMFDGEEPRFNSPEGVEALNVMREMVGTSSRFGYQNTAETALVTTGEAAMGLSSPYVDCSEDGIGDKCDDLSYFTLTDERQIMYCGGRVAAVGGDTEYPEASLAFARAFQEQTIQEEISVLDVGVPLSQDSGESEFVSSNPAGSFSWENLDKCVFEYAGPTFLDFRSEFGPAIDSALLGQRPPQQVLDELADVARG